MGEPTEDRTEHQDEPDSAERRRERGEDPADRGPGAHSGRETEMQHTVVPGTASAAEGFSGGGTLAGEPLEGVEAHPADAQAAAEAAEAADAEATDTGGGGADTAEETPERGAGSAGESRGEGT